MGVRILIPPGIGDAYWVLVKLQAFLQREGLGTPELTVICNSDKYGSEQRSVPFLKMFPFVTVGTPGNVGHTHDDPVCNTSLQEILVEAYSEAGRTIFPGLLGFDYFISYNGQLNTGHWLEEVDVDLACDWFPKMVVSQEQEQFEKECILRFGKYVVFYWPFFGSFEWHTSEFSIDNITKAIQQFIAKTGLRPVFVGARAELEENDKLGVLMNEIPGAVNLVNTLSLGQAFGVLTGSQLVVGYHSGLTNMAVVFKKKTLLLWSSRLPDSIAMACFPPETRNTTYHALFTKDLTVDTFVEKMEALI